ncbi:MAG: putative dehydrogenase [Candidatus Tokpelaia sp. JSC161]|jgi:predicted dehydrogenase|nr:MAG: putative dehydrogenase [Candidatus Tokpelaia sp. JSC161]
MKRIPLGMVGGGQGAFIGAVHRIAARLDNRFELVAGVLSSDSARSAASAREVGLLRSYEDFKSMALSESDRSDGIRAVTIVTPNHMHFPVARTFLGAGIHVICDKPLTATLEQACELAEIVKSAKALLILTYTYTGYPMIREARRLVKKGSLGRLRDIHVEYLQDWLAFDNKSKQAQWRNDPIQSGEGGAISDIGTHAAHLASFVSGLELCEVAADFASFVVGRRVDDDARLLLRFTDDVRGMLWVSQVAHGFDNDIRLRIIGESAGLDWSQKDANRLFYTAYGESKRILTRAGSGFSERARLPAGHPEGYLEAFATLYSDAADAILSGCLSDHLPGISDGLSGMRFIRAAITSNDRNSAWVKV